MDSSISKQKIVDELGETKPLKKSYLNTDANGVKIPAPRGDDYYGIAESVKDKLLIGSWFEHI